MNAAASGKSFLWHRTSCVIYAIFIYNLCRIVCRVETTKVFISRRIWQLFKYCPAGRHVCLLWGWAGELCKCRRFGQMEIICTLRLTRTHTHCEEQSKLGHSKCILEIAGEQPEGNFSVPFCSFSFTAFFFFWSGIGNRLISKSASLISFCSPHLRLVKEFSGAARARKRTAGDC